MKQFKSTNKNLIINWYNKRQQTLCFQGRDGPILRDRLVKLVQNMPGMNNMLNLNTSTVAVLTESQTMSKGSYTNDIQQTSPGREGQESLLQERQYSVMNTDIEGLKLDLPILQKKVEENANLLSQIFESKKNIWYPLRALIIKRGMIICCRLYAKKKRKLKN